MLKNFLAPHDTDVFFRDYWEKKHLFISGDGKGFNELFSVRDLESILDCHAYSLSFPDIRLFKDGKPVPEDVYHEQRACFAFQHIKRKKVNPAKLVELLRTSVSLILCDIQEYNSSLQPFIYQLSEELLEKINGNIIYSAPDVRTFENHADPISAFILQLAGKKKWTIFESPVTENKEDLTSLAVLGEYILNPGDVLYVPKGTWHNAAALEGHSLAVNLAMTSRTLKDVTIKLFESILLPKLFENSYFNEGIYRDQVDALTYKKVIGEKMNDIFNDINHDRLSSLLKKLKEDNFKKYGHSTYDNKFKLVQSQSEP